MKREKLVGFSMCPASPAWLSPSSFLFLSILETFFINHKRKIQYNNSTMSNFHQMVHVMSCIYIIMYALWCPTNDIGKPFCRLISG